MSANILNNTSGLNKLYGRPWFSTESYEIQGDTRAHTANDLAARITDTPAWRSLGVWTYSWYAELSHLPRVLIILDTTGYRCSGCPAAKAVAGIQSGIKTGI